MTLNSLTRSDMDFDQWHIIPSPSVSEDSILIMTSEKRKSWETVEGFCRRLVKEGKIVKLKNVKIREKDKGE